MRSRSTASNANDVGERKTGASFSNLTRRHRFALLTTFRSSGEAVSTPMWFARDGNRVFMVTDLSAGKLRRIANDPRVTVAPCRSQGRPLGPTVEAIATILDEGFSDDAAGALAGRYHLPRWMIERFLRRRGGGAPPRYLELLPPPRDDTAARERPKP
jgi:PPOX class probable F420-dependent enzyme